MTSRKLHSRQRAVRRSVQCDDFVTQAIIANTMHQNGSLPDVLFSTEGKKLSGNETSTCRPESGLGCIAVECVLSG